MVSVFFADTVNAKTRQSSTMTSIILSEPLRRSRNCAGVIRVQHAPHRTMTMAGSSPIDIGGSFRYTSSARMTVSLLNLWRTTVSTTAKMLNNSGDSTHPCRSPCSTSNQSEQTPSSGRIQALNPYWKCWVTASICGGTPMQVSTYHRRVRSTVSYAFWRSIKHMKRDTPAFRPISCDLRTKNIISVVERSGRNLHCSSGNSPFASQ